MPYRLDAFSGVGLDEAMLRLAIDEHTAGVVPRLNTFWTYYRNPSTPVGPAQVAGLPHRLQVGGRYRDDRMRPEVVIENDVAWRIHVMVDFLLGKPVHVLSTARDAPTRRRVERALDAVWEGSGGIALLQDMALLGHVYGYVDLLLRVDERMLAGGRAPGEADGSRPEELARRVRIEVIDPARGIPVLDPSDYRRLDAYVIHFERELNAVERRAPGARVFGPLAGRRSGAQRRRSTVTEIFSGRHWQRYEDENLVAESALALTGGAVPVVHIQNISQPFRYAGLGEVEPLMTLQDELNTRLSDRASRVTMQSFKMYLAKGLDAFDRLPVGPGQVWQTDNPEAEVVAFGGDGASPSEESHIDEVREAFDKTSGVPPLASGVVRAKIGNLTSANALKITLMGILSKTARKRVTYGGGIARMSGLVLTALDGAGVVRTDPRDRGVRIEWPDPLPQDIDEQMRAAKAKVELGVPAERVLAELGYAPKDAGVT